MGSDVGHKEREMLVNLSIFSVYYFELQQFGGNYFFRKSLIFEVQMPPLLLQELRTNQHTKL